MDIGSLLDANEIAVFKTIYDFSLEKSSKWITVEEATRTLVDSGMSKEQIQECLDIILGRRLMDETVGKIGTGRIHTVQTNAFGFTLYANAFTPDIDRIHKDTLDAIVHQGLATHKQVAVHLGKSKILITYMFDVLKSQGYIRTSQTIGSDSDYKVIAITAEGKKAAGKPNIEQASETNPVEQVEENVDRINLSEKEDKRNRVLLRVYLESGGDTFNPVPDQIIVDTEGVTHEELMRDIQPYLQKRGLIKYAAFKATAVDQAGIDKVEQELLKQREPITTPSPATTKTTDFSFITDLRIQKIVKRDYAELQRLDPSNSPKSVLVLAGGIIEGILLDALVVTGDPRWTFEKACDQILKEMIGTSVHKGIIKEHRLTDALRNYRNVIHPGKEVKENIVFDESDAKIAQAGVDVIIREVRAWHSKRASATS